MEKEPKPKIQPERYEQSSFDVVASIRLIRHDLQATGQIHPETMQRVYDEELSCVAEGVDRHSYTKFTLQRDERMGLVYFDQGEWKPYMGALMKGMVVAKREAEEDSRREFRISDVAGDLMTAYKMGALKPGESMQWDSPYPEAQGADYGEEFMAELGYQPQRKMGFLYRAQCNEDGSVTLESHTVDNSDSDAFEAVRALKVYHPDADMEVMLRTYDGKMLTKHEKRYRAGRLITEEKLEVNAYEFIQRHKRLVEYYFDEVKAMATSNLTLEELRQPKKDLTYGFWARIKELLNGESLRTSMPTQGQPETTTIPASREQIASEVQRAHQSASSRGEVMSGCGGSIKGKSLSDMGPDEVFDSVFGDKLEKEKTNYSFDKKMFCVSCQAPPEEEESKKMCGPCGLCKDCDAKYSK